MASAVHPYSDYGVALRTLRSGRNYLGILLAGCVMLQVFGFVLMRFTAQPYVAMKPQLTKTALHPAAVRPVHGPKPDMPAPVSSPVSAAHKKQKAVRPPVQRAGLMIRTSQGRNLDVRGGWDTTYFLLVPLTQLLGVVAAASQAIIIFITLLLILVAQAPGVAFVTRSLIWAVLIFFMVLPWQYFAANFPIPGVLYGYNELLRDVAPYIVRTPGHKIYMYQQALLLARFFLWPLMALAVMIMTAERFRAGMRMAIGHPLQSIMQPPPSPMTMPNRDGRGDANRDRNVELLPSGPMVIPGKK